MLTRLIEIDELKSAFLNKRSCGGILEIHSMKEVYYTMDLLRIQKYNEQDKRNYDFI